MPTLSTGEPEKLTVEIMGDRAILWYTVYSLGVEKGFSTDAYEAANGAVASVFSRSAKPEEIKGRIALWWNVFKLNANAGHMPTTAQESADNAIEAAYGK